MIFTKVPLRVSLFGGGTDLPDYFERFGGTVTGFTINKYITIFSSPIEIDQGFNIRLSYRENQDVQDLNEISHPLFRTALIRRKISERFHFSTMSCLPSGAGLGSSSAFTVGLLELLNTIQGVDQSSMSVAREAIHIERNILGEKGGWQDQLHPAFGGINTFDFTKEKSIIRNPIDLDAANLNLLSDNMYLLYTGKLRSANGIESSKTVSRTNDTFLEATYGIAKEGEKILRSNAFDLVELGKLMTAGWDLKRQLSSKVTNNDIDDMYKLILSKGALGAKLCGAGGGGFFLVMCNDKVIRSIQSSLGGSMITKIAVTFNGVVKGSI